MSNYYLLFIAIVAGMGVAYAGLADNSDALKKTTAKQAQTDAIAVPATQQGLKVYIDPTTGKRGMPPQGVVVPSAPVAPRAATTVAPKVIDLGSSKGQAIDMRGHYQETIAHVDQNGKLTTHCESGSSQHSQTGGEGVK